MYKAPCVCEISEGKLTQQCMHLGDLEKNVVKMVLLYGVGSTGYAEAYKEYTTHLIAAATWAAQWATQQEQQHVQEKNLFVSDTFEHNMVQAIKCISGAIYEIAGSSNRADIRARNLVDEALRYAR